jgi:hypothetical protein
MNLQLLCARKVVRLNLFRDSTYIRLCVCEVLLQCCLSLDEFRAVCKWIFSHKEEVVKQYLPEIKREFAKLSILCRSFSHAFSYCVDTGCKIVNIHIDLPNNERRAKGISLVPNLEGDIFSFSDSGQSYVAYVDKDSGALRSRRLGEESIVSVLYYRHSFDSLVDFRDEGRTSFIYSKNGELFLYDSTLRNNIFNVEKIPLLFPGDSNIGSVNVFSKFIPYFSVTAILSCMFSFKKEDHKLRMFFYSLHLKTFGSKVHFREPISKFGAKPNCTIHDSLSTLGTKRGRGAPASLCYHFRTLETVKLRDIIPRSYLHSNS